MKRGKVIDVGGNGDCGFLSIAAALIDLYLNQQLSQALVAGAFDEFFELYGKYFPSQMPANKKASAHEICEHLSKAQSPNALVKNFAYVLRQYAVDIIVKNPADYRGAFIEDKGHGATSPAEMRKPGMWISATEIAALARTFQVPTVVRSSTFTTKLYEGPTQCEGSIEIHLNGGHYQPKIELPEYFQGANQATAVVPEQIIVKKDPTIKEIKVKIAEVEARDLKREQDAKIAMNKYSTLDLIKIYQRALEKSDYLPGKIAAVTEENKDDLFFFNAVVDNKVDPAREADIRAILLHALGKQTYIDPAFDHAKIYSAVQQDEKSKQNLHATGMFAKSNANTCVQDAIEMLEFSKPQATIALVK